MYNTATYITVYLTILYGLMFMVVYNLLSIWLWTLTSAPNLEQYEFRECVIYI